MLTFSALKNIQYPLLWHDETETAVGAQRVLQFGYPVVDDGRNILNMLETEDKSIGVHEATNAYTAHAWAQFYWAAIGVKLAQLTNDIYLQTGLVRAPFAIIGLWGISLLGIITARLFNFSSRLRWITIAGYLTLNILSVSLLLHLREVRYYALSLTVTNLWLYLFWKYRNPNDLKNSSPNLFVYSSLMSLVHLAGLVTFIPLFFALITSTVFAEAYLQFWYNRTNRVNLLSKARWFIGPIVPSLLVSIPIFKFTNSFAESLAIRQHVGFTGHQYFYNFLHALQFLSLYQFLGLAILTTTITLTGWYLTRQTQTSITTHNILPFLFVAEGLIIIYLVIVSGMPYLFERYLTAIIPLVNLIIPINVVLNWHFINAIKSTQARSDAKFVYVALTTTLLVLSLTPQVDQFRGRLYELTHQYQGPLDFAIPYLQNQFEHPEELVIATNYEELSYAFYLGSKVTIGYVGNNLKEDLTIQPDVIIMRKDRPNFVTELRDLLSHAEYEKVIFPVYDYQFNNIPELYIPLPHLYKTKYAENESEALTLYVRTNTLRPPN